MTQVKPVFTLPMPKLDPIVLSQPLTEKAPTRKRNELRTVLGLSIPPARVRSHLQFHVTEKEDRIKMVDYETSIEKLKKSIETAKTAQQMEQVVQLTTELDKIKKEKNTYSGDHILRIGGTVGIALSAIIDRTLTELLLFGFKQAHVKDHKLVTVHDFHNDPKTTEKVQSLRYYPIFSRLKVYRDFTAADEEKACALLSEERKHKLEEKKVTTIDVKTTPVSEMVLPSTASTLVTPEDDESIYGVRTTFETYIDNTINTIKKDERYVQFAEFRVAKRIRIYLSDLVENLICLFGKQTKLLIAANKVKTINEEFIRLILQFCFNEYDQEFLEIEEFINECLEHYTQFTKTEQVRRDESMNAEKKSERARKEKEKQDKLTLERAAAAQKRAQKAALEAQELANKAAAITAATVLA